jgi:hypothetical protein
MPPKKSVRNKINKKIVKRPVRNELSTITAMLAKLNKPKSEVTDLGRMLLGGGNMLGGLVGMPKIFGSGAYSCDQNTLMVGNQQVPFMHSDSESVRFRHREYITDVSMNGAAYTALTYNINPGLVGTFPFLSGIASNFQEYSFEGLVFEYKSTSATALVSGTNTALGSVLMAAQYRADAPLFTSKISLLNEMWSVDCKPSDNVILPIECAPKENPFAIQYVRSLAATGDVKMFDLAVVTIATDGGQIGQTNVVGELWVSYDVVLRKPQASILTAGFTVAFDSTTYSSALPIGTPVILQNAQSAIITSNTITIPSGFDGWFLFQASWQAATAIMVSPPAVTATPNVTSVTTSANNTGDTVKYSLFSFYFFSTGIGPATLTLGGLPQLPTTGTPFANFIITQVFAATSFGGFYPPL